MIINIQIPKHLQNKLNHIKSILEAEDYHDRLLQRNCGQLWGRIKDNFPEMNIQHHVLAFYRHGKLIFRPHTEASRHDLAHANEKYTSYEEGARLFMELLKKYGINDFNYSGNAGDLHKTPPRPTGKTPWVPLLVVTGFLGAVIVFVLSRKRK